MPSVAFVVTGLKSSVSHMVSRLLSLFGRKTITTNPHVTPSFEFRLRFNMLKDDRIKSDKEELELLRTEHGQRIRLRAGSRGSPIEKSSQMAVTGGPYRTEGEARNAANAAQQAVTVWSVRQRLGVDFGDGRLRSLMTDVGKQYYEAQLDRPLRNDRLGIDVYRIQEGLLFASVSFEAAVNKNPDIFVEQFRDGMTKPLKLSEKQRLAAELYSLSFFDMSFRSRFITLVTAVEALLDPASRSGEIQLFVDDVKVRLDTLGIDESTKRSMTSSLERIKYDSIGQTGRALADTLLCDREYGGLKAGKFFNHCYQLRSEIVHSGKHSDASVDLLQESNACQAFVGDLLLASFGLTSA